MKILFFGKENDRNAEIAADYVRQIFPEAQAVFGNRNQAFPVELLDWQGDYVFSYLSPWIIPETVLKGAKQAAINWHPGPPSYPGIGCTNFAIYNNETEFGITCHHMLGKVDTGRIIAVERFPILPRDSVYSITQKCYAHILRSFFAIIEAIASDQPLPVSNETWQRKPYTRKELNALSQITPELPKIEIEKRIKATTYDRPWAFVDIEGKRFYYQGEAPQS